MAELGNISFLATLFIVTVILFSKMKFIYQQKKSIKIFKNIHKAFGFIILILGTFHSLYFIIHWHEIDNTSFYTGIVVLMGITLSAFLGIKGEKEITQRKHHMFASLLFLVILITHKTMA